MKRLWAPWRAEYINSGTGKDEGCLFCTAPEKDPERALVLYSGPSSVVMLNKYPYNSGHLMVAPLRHTSNIEDMTAGESADIFRLIQHSTVSLKKTFKPHGFNVGVNLGSAAGAGIEGHLHFHVVPRWNGDMNFMPVLSDVKVMPEHLEATYRKLRPLFAGI